MPCVAFLKLINFLSSSNDEPYLVYYYFIMAGYFNVIIDIMFYTVMLNYL